ncbi:glycoside hydrolase family 32 protein [Fodinibius sp. SL11]|uniref:glycoside hydrolase family 32 protein n=1 Tax=Fodinibius sp. SL11 TaxID=3425690 RepID=UPI003F882D96
MKNFISFWGAIMLVSAGLLLSACQTNDQTNGVTSEDDIAYDELYRPQFHFTPAQNWINDPNGLVYHDGEYHLFYQYNPFGDQWGHMSWGHAVSTDLMHWEELDVALQEEDGIMIFSGSAVVDKQNTSGLGAEENPPMVAIYTGHHDSEENPKQDQRIAYSTDNGRSWTKYEGNPVIDEEMENFRDPKVIWHEETEKWIMVVALPTEYKVRFYSSDNLIDWKMESEFGPAGGTGGIWECPDLFKLPVDGHDGESRWVLQVDMNPGAVAGGSGGQYFVGDFDGSEFTESEETKGETLWVDYGKDFYAVQSYSNIPDGRRIWLAWMNNWNYAGEIPTNPWRGAMTIPRKVGLMSTDEGPRLTQKTVDELNTIAGEAQQFENITISDGLFTDENLEGTTYKIEAEIQLNDAERVGFNLRKGDEEQTVVGYDVRAEELFVDRRNSGEVSFHEDFAAEIQTAPLRLNKNILTLEILVDRSSVEVFSGKGDRSITNRIFPSESSNGIEIFSEGGAAEVVNLGFRELQSTWSNSQ